MQVIVPSDSRREHKVKYYHQKEKKSQPSGENKPVKYFQTFLPRDRPTPRTPGSTERSAIYGHQKRILVRKYKAARSIDSPLSSTADTHALLHLPYKDLGGIQKKYRVLSPSGISDLCGTVAGMVTPKVSMSTEGETLQIFVLPYRCSICSPLVTWQMSIL